MFKKVAHEVSKNSDGFKCVLCGKLYKRPPTVANCLGIMTYTAWEQVPNHLMSKSKLASEHKRRITKDDAPSAAVFNGKGYTELYTVEQGKPIQAKEHQLKALEAARNATPKILSNLSDWLRQSLGLDETWTIEVRKEQAGWQSWWQGNKRGGYWNHHAQGYYARVHRGDLWAIGSPIDEDEEEKACINCEWKFLGTSKTEALQTISQLATRLKFNRMVYAMENASLAYIATLASMKKFASNQHSNFDYMRSPDWHGNRKRFTMRVVKRSFKESCQHWKRSQIENPYKNLRPIEEPKEVIRSFHRRLRSKNY